MREDPEEAEWHQRLIGVFRQVTENRRLLLTKTRPDEHQALLQRLNRDTCLAFQSGTLGTQAMARLTEQAGRLRLCPRPSAEPQVVEAEPQEVPPEPEATVVEVKPEIKAPEKAPGQRHERDAEPSPPPPRREIKLEVVDDYGLLGRPPDHWKKAWVRPLLPEQSSEESSGQSSEESSPRSSPPQPQLKPRDTGKGLGIERVLITPDETKET